MAFVSSRRGQVLLGFLGLFGSIDLWGHVTRAYVTMPHIDIATHFLFGVSLALALIYRGRPDSRLVIFLIVLIVGVGWELLEFTYDHWYAFPNGISPAQHGISDTLKDMLSNSIGALSSLFLFPKPHQSEVEPVSSSVEG